MIRNIIFDVGKVLVSYEPEEMMQSIGLTLEEIAVVNEALFMNPLWDECDRSAKSDVTLLAQALTNARDIAFSKGNKDITCYDSAIERAWEHVGDAIELLPYVKHWLQELKDKGYHLYVLSNYGAHTYEKTVHKMEFLPYMEGALFSFTCKYMKPEPEIYDRLLAEYNLKPEECIFIDDRQVNIEGAESCGIKGLLFTEYETTAKKLQEILADETV